MAMLEKISLSFCQGSSDKFYNICIMEDDDGLCTVPFTYGRTGTSGQSGDKVKAPVTYEKAKKAYDKVVKEKMSKGYVTGSSGTTHVSGVPSTSSATPVFHTQVTPPTVSGVLPQLLVPVEESEIEKFINDPRYGAQEKKDGRRKFMQRKGDTTVSINKKGLEVGYPHTYDVACQALAEGNMNEFLVDGEEVGPTYYIFDVLSFGPESFKGLPYKQRYELLKDAMKEAFGDEDSCFELVPLAVTTEEKRAMYEKLKAENAEGIVFKLLDAPYTEGRPSDTWSTYANNYPQIKIKFYATCTCVVLKQNDKRSVQLGLLDGNVMTFVGNCTIPPNKDIPEEGMLVEIRYLYAYKGGSIYQPTYLIPRDDIDEDECLMSQLKYKPE